MSLLAQTPTPDATKAFYLTLLAIFIAAVVTTLLTKWSRDKCLKYFRGYHVTLERARGITIWGTLKVFPTGIEIMFDRPYIDPRGHRKHSFMIYQSELDTALLSLLRFHDELDADQQRRRLRQVRRSFNPGPLKRLQRAVRNIINTLRDAFGAAIGATVWRFQRMNPASALVSAQGGTQVTQLGQTLLGSIANAYEPLLEQYIGHPVILDVADPVNPNNAAVEYVGYLAGYTQQFLAVFNIDHPIGEQFTVMLPSIERGDPLPPMPPPPPPGAPAPVLPPPLSTEHEIAVRIDHLRFRVQNLRYEPVVVRRIEREGFEPLEIGVIIPPSGTLELPARDARGGRLVLEAVRRVDVIAPRRYATIRHAGELIERSGWADELHLRTLPMVPRPPGEPEAATAPADDEKESEH